MVNFMSEISSSVSNFERLLQLLKLFWGAIKYWERSLQNILGDQTVLGRFSLLISCLISAFSSVIM